uniref:Uncharacterized protein n=1 Tax=Plectus sambesii TaxID=2011161 RepID=A0A914UY68_9BILA
MGSAGAGRTFQLLKSHFPGVLALSDLPNVIDLGMLCVACCFGAGGGGGERGGDGERGVTQEESVVLRNWPGLRHLSACRLWVRCVCDSRGAKSE